MASNGGITGGHRIGRDLEEGSHVMPQVLPCHLPGRTSVRKIKFN